MSRALFVGVDAGSTTLKVVILDDSARGVWHAIEPASPLVQPQAIRMVAQGLSAVGRPGPGPEGGPWWGEPAVADGVVVVATGYGRKLVPGAAMTPTEIACHARGAYFSLGQAGTLIDIGGQDSKVIRFGAEGAVEDFAMNDKCAAGTGRFLENTAQRLGLQVGQLDELALSTLDETPISSTCTVFAESEIISLLARAVPLPSIVRGLHRAMVSRVASLVRTVGVKGPLFLSGGVAMNRAVQWMLAQELGGGKVVVPEAPQRLGALGAALTGLRSGR